jgi:AAA+ ATPase superfamily predicted ATPase
MSKRNMKKSNEIIGRVEEKDILNRLLKSKKAEFLALYGRRRVGKTFLIRNFFKDSACLFFHCTGIQNGSLEDQLKEFAKQVGETFHHGVTPAFNQSWLDAFEVLNKSIESCPKSQPIIVFFDEFPWMATKRSRLLQALEYYWNHYWNHDSRIKLIICGSSASWIIDKIINNKGGLYNRATQTMRLDPFSLVETRDYLFSLGVRLNNRQVLDLYMVLGGIPHYLAHVKKGRSSHQNIEELCFKKNGPLMDEFHRLFGSLFKESSVYINLVRIIAKSKEGVSQSEISRVSKISRGGRITKKLKQLEDAGFILSFLPHLHQEKGLYYKVIDEYTLFYLYWIEEYLKSTRKQDQSSGYWMAKAQSPSWNCWAGLTFEAVCHKHVAQIRKALAIPPGSQAVSWRHQPRSRKGFEGAQIDLLFDRPDKTITICEIKHSEKPFLVDKEYAQAIERKIRIYKQLTGTAKDIFFAIIASSGLKPNTYSEKLDAQEATLEDLFKF